MLPTKEEIKGFILETIVKEKPENSEKLRQLMLQQHSINPELTAQLLIELENEGKIHLTRPQKAIPNSAKEYVFSQKAFWYWGIVALSIATTISVFAIPAASYPAAYARTVLGYIFVLFLPGYAFIKVLFPTTVPFKTNSENFDSIERFALSITLSIALVPLVGLVLNYTPWGIPLTPITLSLLAFTIVFATAALLREYQVKPKPAKLECRS